MPPSKTTVFLRHLLLLCRYINSIQAEQNAFRNLIMESARIALPAQLFPTKTTGDGRADGGAPISTVVDNSVPKYSPAPSTRVGGGLVKKTEPDKIVVDMREFRSALPSILHARGFQIVPVTLEVRASRKIALA